MGNPVGMLSASSTSDVNNFVEKNFRENAEFYDASLDKDIIQSIEFDYKWSSTKNSSSNQYYTLVNNFLQMQFTLDGWFSDDVVKGAAHGKFESSADSTTVVISDKTYNKVDAWFE